MRELKIFREWCKNHTTTDLYDAICLSIDNFNKDNECLNSGCMFQDFKLNVCLKEDAKQACISRKF